MTTWTRSEQTKTTIRYVVPVPSAWNQVEQAMAAAVEEYQEMVNSNNTPSDNSIMVEADDDAIVIYFEKKPGIPPKRYLNTDDPRAHYLTEGPR